MAERRAGGVRRGEGDGHEAEQGRGAGVRQGGCRGRAGGAGGAGGPVVGSRGAGGEGGIGDWSEEDIANLLETGFTPEFDSVGGAMADVVRNTSQLTAVDRDAMAAYLKSIPPHPNGYTAAPTPAQ